MNTNIRGIPSVTHDDESTRAIRGAPTHLRVVGALREAVRRLVCARFRRSIRGARIAYEDARRSGASMFMHHKKLQLTVHVHQINPDLESLLREQFGRSQDDLAAAMRYFTESTEEQAQRYREITDAGNDSHVTEPAPEGSEAIEVETIEAEAIEADARRRESNQSCDPVTGASHRYERGQQG